MTQWLDRRIAAPAPYLALCLSEGDFRSAVAHCKVSNAGEWISDGKHATTHVLTHDGKSVCLVCLDGFEGRNPVEVAGLLVHEAVHVWQNYASDIGEHRPGAEQEAYAVQSIAQELMAEFARRMEAAA